MHTECLARCCPLLRSCSCHKSPRGSVWCYLAFSAPPHVPHWVPCHERCTPPSRVRYAIQALSAAPHPARPVRRTGASSLVLLRCVIQDSPDGTHHLFPTGRLRDELFSALRRQPVVSRLAIVF